MNTNNHKVYNNKTQCSVFARCKTTSTLERKLEIKPPNLQRHDSFHPDALPVMGYRHWKPRCLTDRPDSATRQVLRPEPTRPEAKRTQRGDSPWFRLDGSARITSLLRYFPGHAGAENVHGPVPGSPEHFSNSVGAAEDVQPGSNAPPAGAA